MESVALRIDKICRTCLCETSDPICLNTDIETKFSLSDMVSLLTNINIIMDEKYPKQVCNTCHNFIRQVYEFKQNCIQSENILKEIICCGKQRDLKQNVIKIELGDISECYQCGICYKKFTDINLLEHHVKNHMLTKQNDSVEQCEKKDITIEIIGSNNYIEDILTVKQEKDVIENDIDFELDVSFPSPEYKEESLDKKCGVKIKDDYNYTNNECSINKIDMKIETKKDIKHFVCPICGMPLYTLKTYETHMQIHKDDPKTSAKFQCSMCMRVFQRKTSLKMHLKKHEIKSKIKHTCSICKREFQHEAHLHNHITSVHKLNKYNCEGCDQSFSRLPELEHHIITEHKDIAPRVKRMKCNICNKSFYAQSTLKDHLRTHTGEKPYLCATCGRGFSQKTNLAQHMRRHQGLKPFKCDQCERGFVSKGELVAHQRIHSGAHPFVCDDCGSGFTTSSSLVKHRRVHTGERPYACDLCSMKFAASGTLKNHRRTHTGEKPYQCSYCEKAFVQRQDLISHIRCHTGERPYVCTSCGQSFRKASVLRAHLKVHEKEPGLRSGVGGLDLVHS